MCEREREGERERERGPALLRETGEGETGKGGEVGGVANRREDGPLLCAKNAARIFSFLVPTFMSQLGFFLVLF